MILLATVMHFFCIHSSLRIQEKNGLTSSKVTQNTSLQPVGMLNKRMTLRKKNPTATRARILLSAGEEFRRLGFQAARLNAIVEHSGITKGSLFHHFAGKDDLAQQWMQETLPPLLDEQWLSPLRDATDPIQTIKGILREQARVLESTAASEFFGNPLAILSLIHI